MRKIIPFLIVLIIIGGANQWLNAKVGITFFWWSIEGLLLLFFLFCKESKINRLPLVIEVYLLWVLVSGFMGIFMAEGYWDFKELLSNLMFYMLPLSVCYFMYPSNFARISKYCLTFLPFIFLFLIPYAQLEGIGRILMIIPSFLLFLPSLPLKGRIYMLVGFIIVFVMGTLGARATVMRFIVAFLFSMSLLFPNKLYTLQKVKSLYFILFFIPILFFVLAVNTNLNLFELAKEKYEGVYMEKNSFNAEDNEDLSADTRTFLYVETINSALDNNYIIWGHSLARGYVSPHFGVADLTDRKRGERGDCEVAILNIFTHMGLIGVVLYSLIFLTACKNALFKSRSIFMKLVGLWLAFRWLFSWVEEFTRFDINNIYLWAFIAMCFSQIYLKMSNRAFVNYLRRCMPGKS